MPAATGQRIQEVAHVTDFALSAHRCSRPSCGMLLQGIKAPTVSLYRFITRALGLSALPCHSVFLVFSAVASLMDREDRLRGCARCLRLSVLLISVLLQLIQPQNSFSVPEMYTAACPEGRRRHRRTHRRNAALFNRRCFLCPGCLPLPIPIDRGPDKISVRLFSYKLKCAKSAGKQALLENIDEDLIFVRKLRDGGYSGNRIRCLRRPIENAR